MEEKNEKMELIDFDDKFTQVLNDWVEKNQTKFANADEMEAAMPDVYLRFLNTPADWLGGKAPGNAFDDVSDAGELVALMKRYIEEEIFSLCLSESICFRSLNAKSTYFIVAK